jgi:hypothetical protein
MYPILRVAVGGFLAILALALAAPVGADVTFNTTEPYSETAENTCTGDFVQLMGTMHTVMRMSVLDGGHTHFGGSTEFGGLNGTTVDGVRYVETRIENFGGSFDSDFMPSETNTETLQILTRLGEDGSFVEGDDLRVHISAHVTVNANGTFTVDRTDSSVQCN